MLAGNFDALTGPEIIDKPISLSLPGGGSVPNLANVKNLRDLKLPTSLPAADFASTLPPKASKFTAGVTGEGSIDFPILKPENIFKLLMGQPDVTLVQIELPEFGFDFFYRQSFPIIGPLVGTFGGGVGGGVDMGFGYDTRGLAQFMATKNPASLLSGFFLSDLDPATGADRAEAFLRRRSRSGPPCRWGSPRSASRAASRRPSSSTWPTWTTTARSVSTSWPPTSSPTTSTRWRSSTSAGWSSCSCAPTSR